MRMDNESEVPSPFITPKHLNSYLLKPVIVAGKVQSANDSTLVLDGGDHGRVTVMRCKPSQVMVQIGMNLLVRGFVNQDLTVAESKRFPPTDLGDNFDQKLYNDAAAVTSHLNYVHMFST